MLPGSGSKETAVSRRTFNSSSRRNQNNAPTAIEPLEGRQLFAVTLGPDFCSAAAFDHQKLLFVEMLLRIERAGAGDFDDKAAP